MEKKFRKLFWPTFIELLFFMLMGTIDTLMLSNFSDYAVGAVGNANTLIQLFAVLFLVISNGVAVLVSQYLGANQKQIAFKVIGTGLIVNIIVGLVLSTTLVLSSDVLLNIVNTKPEIFVDSKTYLQVISISLIFVAASNVMTATLRSFQHPKYITYIVITANILNIIGNYALIYGHFGLPRLGVYGAAISTLIVRGLMMIAYAILITKLIKFKFTKIKVDRLQAKQILKIGLPSALESWTYTIMQAVILSMINGLGSEFTIARTYINTVFAYIYIFSLAFASANAVLTGFNVGKRDYEKAYLGTMKTARLSFIIVTTVTLIVNLFSRSIFGIFTQNQEILNIATKVLWLAIPLEFGRGLNLIIIQALRSASDTTIPLVMALLSMIGIAIPFAYFFGVYLGLGLFGIYIAYAMDEVIRGSVMLYRWISKKWTSKTEYLDQIAVKNL